MGNVYSNNTDNPDLTTALGGVAPIADDEININQHSTKFATTTGLGVDLQKLLLGPKWKGGFAAPLTFVCNQGGTGTVEVRGGSENFTMGSVLKANVHSNVFINLANALKLTYTTCTITALQLWNGRVYINDDCIASAIIAKAGADLTLAGAGTPETSASLLQKGGLVLNNRIITLATVDGDSTFRMDNAAGSVGTLNFSGKVFEWFRGNIGTKLNAYTGTIDMSGIKAAPTIADYLIAEGVKVILPPKNIMANPFTDATKYIGSGPTFVASS